MSESVSTAFFSSSWGHQLKHILGTPFLKELSKGVSTPRS